jgi:hypothetical protein
MSSLRASSYLQRATLPGLLLVACVCPLWIDLRPIQRLAFVSSGPPWSFLRNVHMVSSSTVKEERSYPIPSRKLMLMRSPVPKLFPVLSQPFGPRDPCIQNPMSHKPPLPPPRRSGGTSSWRRLHLRALVLRSRPPSRAEPVPELSPQLSHLLQGLAQEVTSDDRRQAG